MSYLESKDYKFMRFFVYIMGLILMLGIIFISYIIYIKSISSINIKNKTINEVSLNKKILDIKILDPSKILIYTKDELIIFDLNRNSFVNIIKTNGLRV